MLDCASGAVYAWLLGDEELCSRRVASDFEKFFIALASIYITRLNGETMPSSEQILNFVQADDAALDFGKRWRKFSKFYKFILATKAKNTFYKFSFDM